MVYICSFKEERVLFAAGGPGGNTPFFEELAAELILSFEGGLGRVGHLACTLDVALDAGIEVVLSEFVGHEVLEILDRNATIVELILDGQAGVSENLFGSVP